MNYTRSIRPRTMADRTDIDALLIGRSTASSCRREARLAAHLESHPPIGLRSPTSHTRTRFARARVQLHSSRPSRCPRCSCRSRAPLAQERVGHRRLVLPVHARVLLHPAMAPLRCSCWSSGCRYAVPGARSLRDHGSPTVILSTESAPAPSTPAVRAPPPTAASAPPPRPPRPLNLRTFVVWWLPRPQGERGLARQRREGSHAALRSHPPSRTATASVSTKPS